MPSSSSFHTEVITNYESNPCGQNLLNNPKNVCWSKVVSFLHGFLNSAPKKEKKRKAGRLNSSTAFLDSQAILLIKVSRIAFTKTLQH